MDLYNRFTSPGGKDNPLTGGAIASGDSISPDYLVHHITGTGVISTIKLPYPGFNGPIYLISDDGFEFDTAGNIATTGIVTAKTVVPLVYDLPTNKWYTLPVGLIPFTLQAGLTGDINSSEELIVSASDFLNSFGGYLTFQISKTQGGPYTDNITFNCPEVGLQTVYILGTNGSRTLELSTSITVLDGFGYCTP